jgi:hypothetical protein
MVKGWTVDDITTRSSTLDEEGNPPLKIFFFAGTASASRAARAAVAIDTRLRTEGACYLGDIAAGAGFIESV